ncbi:DUF1653 domain-containing protein [Candidatus Saccharibacteria bacterium]|nr:DUF1653 domain-containing protein [Candidatus Saccharibacteria bacterium]
MSELKSGVYRHYKGGLYLALGVARHSETDEKLVAYVPLGVQEGPRITVRPYNMFFEIVEVNGNEMSRFEYIDEAVAPEVAARYDHLSGYNGSDRQND